MEVLAKYVEIDTDKLEIQIDQSATGVSDSKVPVLLANIPIKSMKNR
jgi:septum formation topological specificity factor MinE